MKQATTILQTLEHQSKQLQALGVENIALFGSAARGEANKNSDLDFIVTFKHKSFDAYMELKFFLEDLFACPIDLVLHDNIKTRLKPYILEEALHVPGL